MNKIISILILILFINIHSDSGQAAWEGLNIIPTARLVALYNSPVIDESHLMSVNTNPASVTDLKSSEIGFGHNLYIAGIQQSYVIYSFPVSSHIIYSDLNLIQYGHIQRRTYSNPTGTGLDSFNSNDIFFGIGYAHRFYDNISLGLKFNVLSQLIDSVYNNGATVNIGGVYNTGMKGLDIGFSLSNLGFSSELLPVNFKCGLGYTYFHDIVGYNMYFTLNKTTDAEIYYSCGFELVVQKILFLRAGYSNINDLVMPFSGGIGVKIKNYYIDYAFVKNDYWTWQHMINIKIQFQKEQADYNIDYMKLDKLNSLVIKNILKNLKHDPKDAKSHFSLGLALDQYGLVDYAIKEFELAVELAPDRKLYKEKLQSIKQKDKK